MHYMTKITRDQFAGKKFTGDRDATDHRRLAPRKRDRNNTCATPRTREGKVYPGGRALRRAMKALAVRVAAHTDSESRTKPGSMK